MASFLVSQHKRQSVCMWDRLQPAWRACLSSAAAGLGYFKMPWWVSLHEASYHQHSRFHTVHAAVASRGGEMSECLGWDFRLIMGSIFSQSFWTEATHDWESHQEAPDCPHRPPIRQWCVYSALLEFKVSTLLWFRCGQVRLMGVSFSTFLLNASKLTICSINFPV